MDHLWFVNCVSHAFASVHSCLVVTCWERADFLTFFSQKIEILKMASKMAVN